MYRQTERESGMSMLSFSDITTVIYLIQPPHVLKGFYKVNERMSHSRSVN